MSETDNIEHLVATADKGERQISAALSPKFYSSISVSPSFLPANLIICSAFPSTAEPFQVQAEVSISWFLLDVFSGGWLNGVNTDSRLGSSLLEIPSASFICHNDGVVVTLLKLQCCMICWKMRQILWKRPDSHGAEISERVWFLCGFWIATCWIPLKLCHVLVTLLYESCLFCVTLPS